METIKVDREFESFIPPLTDDEFNQLRDNILKDKEVRDPLIVWNNIIVDGHNRWRIIKDNPDLKWNVKEMDFPDRESALNWMIKNQLGRRNLTKEQQSYLRGKQYNTERKTQGGDRRTGDFSKSQNETLKTEDTATRIAKEHGVTRATIMRDSQYADGIDDIRSINEEAADKILKGKSKVTKNDVSEFPDKTTDDKKEMVERIVLGDDDIKPPKKSRKPIYNFEDAESRLICDYEYFSKRIEELLNTKAIEDIAFAADENDLSPNEKLFIADSLMDLADTFRENLYSYAAMLTATAESDDD